MLGVVCTTLDGLSVDSNLMPGVGEGGKQQQTLQVGRSQRTAWFPQRTVRFLRLTQYELRVERLLYRVIIILETTYAFSGGIA